MTPQVTRAQFQHHPWN